jgi:hypothetical protein
MHGLGGDGLTLGQFIDDTYIPWVKASRPRTAANTLGKLNRLFSSWFAETRHVCLNEEATRVLQCWRDQVKGGLRVFETRTSFKTAWAPLLKRAQISKFRWHDLRHHFASRLV